MVKILLASSSKIKQNAIKKWFKLYIKEKIDLDTLDIEDNLVPPQPINSGGLMCCNDRLTHINNKKKKVDLQNNVYEDIDSDDDDNNNSGDDNNNSGDDDDNNDNEKYNLDINDYDYVISIENALKIANNKIIDGVYISIENCKTHERFTEYGEEITIDYTILEKYPLFLKITQDLYQNYEDTSKKYIYDGSELTLGKIINKHYPDIPYDNWMKNIFNKDRQQQIITVLNKVTNDIKKNLKIQSTKLE